MVVRNLPLSYFNIFNLFSYIIVFKKRRHRRVRNERGALLTWSNLHEQTRRLYLYLSTWSCVQESPVRGYRWVWILSWTGGTSLAQFNIIFIIIWNKCIYSQVCPVSAKCRNTIGSYRCDCLKGFRKDNDEDKVCSDVDECREQFGLCHQNCVNMWGSYRCSCDNGFQLASDNRTCIDVDECTVHKQYDLCMGICENTPGSFQCACPSGYRLAADGRSCQGEFRVGYNLNFVQKILLLKKKELIWQLLHFVQINIRCKM